MGLPFLAFWPCGPSFPFILAFSGSASGPPPTSCQKWPVCPMSLQWIYQRRDRLHFAVFSILGLHFLAFWPCGPSFPCILALWAFISLHFGLVGLHFLSFWPFRGRLLGPPPQVAKNGPFAQRPYNGFISAVTGSILQFLAFWAFISLHFGFVGLHFLAFWPCGPSFPCILALWAFISFHFGLFGVGFWAPPPQVAKNGPFAPRPYNGFISAVTGSILQFLAFWAFISLHFGLVGLHFLAFWPCGPSFPCILALWAFISFHFGLFGVGFWAPPTSCQKWPVCPTSLQWIYQRRDRLHFAVFSILGLHLWIYQRRDRLHFAVFGVSVSVPPHKLPKMVRLPNVLTMDLSAP